MKNIFKCIFAMLIMILLIILTGCCPDFEPKTAVVVASGHHNNMASFNVVKKIFSDTVTDSGSIFLPEKCMIIDIYGIVIDGEPTKSDTTEIDNLNESIETIINNKRWDTAQKRLLEFNEKMFEIPADDPEVDTLEVFSVAANHFETLEKDVEKRIIIYDTGLSTTGTVDFAHNEKYRKLLDRSELLSSEEVQLIVDELSNQKNIPNLDKVMIQWYGIGFVGGKQEELSNIAIENLKTIWRAILKEAGASSVEFKSVDKKKDNNHDKTLPPVSIVDLSAHTIEGTTKAEETTGIVPIDIKKLGFKPYTAEFLDGTEKERRSILNAFVSIGKREQLLVVGTTSTGGENGDGLELSNKRAKAVNDELVILGVPEENIKYIGLGTKHHMYNKDEFVNGVYMGDSKAAQENRSVYIMQRYSEEAEQFLIDYKKIYGLNLFND